MKVLSKIFYGLLMVNWLGNFIAYMWHDFQPKRMTIAIAFISTAIWWMTLLVKEDL